MKWGVGPSKFGLRGKRKFANFALKCKILPQNWVDLRWLTYIYTKILKTHVINFSLFILQSLSYLNYNEMDLIFNGLDQHK